MRPQLARFLLGGGGDKGARCPPFAAFREERRWQRVESMADRKVTVEQLPTGKWACFLHITCHDEPVNLGREFKNDEQAENWLNVSESVMDWIRKYQK